MWKTEIAGRTLGERVSCMSHVPLVIVLVLGIMAVCGSEIDATLVVSQIVLFTVVHQVNPLHRLHCRLSKRFFGRFR